MTGSHESGRGLKLSLCGLIEGTVDAIEPLRDLSPSVGTLRNVSRELIRGRDIVIDICESHLYHQAQKLCDSMRFDKSDSSRRS